jgi:hypothetical protein
MQRFQSHDIWAPENKFQLEQQFTTDQANAEFDAPASERYFSTDRNDDCAFGSVTRQSGRTLLLEEYAKEGLAKNYDFNLLAAVKTTKVNLDSKISPSDFTMGETNEAPSWIAEGDELSVMKQGSIESIISLP